MCRPTFLVKALSKVRQTCAERQWGSRRSPSHRGGSRRWGVPERQWYGSPGRSLHTGTWRTPSPRSAPRGDPLLGLHTADGLLLLTAPLPTLGTGRRALSRPVPAGRPELPLRRPGPGQLLRVRAVSHTGGRQCVKVFRKTPPRTLPRAARDRTRAPFPPAVPVGAARTPPPPRRRPSVSPDTRNPFSQCSGLLATAPRRRIRRSCQLVVTTFRQGREGKTGTGPPGKDLTEPTGRPQSTSVSSDTLWPCRRRTRVTAGLRHNDGTGNTK